MLNSDEASSRGRFTGQRWKGGVWSPTDGIANPTLAAPAAAKAVMALGGTVHQGCAARGIETSGGAISAVVTERARSDKDRRYGGRRLGLVLYVPNGHPFSAGECPSIHSGRVDRRARGSKSVLQQIGGHHPAREGATP
jgi:hypothetical protein